MKDDRIHIPLEFHEQLKNDAKASGKTQLETLMQNYEQGKTGTTVLIPSLKQLTNAYENLHCTNQSCKRLIPVGETFFWGKNQNGKTISLCLDCKLKSSGDKTLINLHQRKRELERLIKAYQNTLDNLAGQFEDIHFWENHRDLLLKNQEWLKILNDWLNGIDNIPSYLDKNQIPEYKLKEQVEKVIELLTQVQPYMIDFRTFYEKRVTAFKERKKIESPL